MLQSQGWDLTHPQYCCSKATLDLPPFIPSFLTDLGLSLFAKRLPISMEQGRSITWRNRRTSQSDRSSNTALSSHIALLVMWLPISRHYVGINIVQRVSLIRWHDHCGRISQTVGNTRGQGIMERFTALGHNYQSTSKSLRWKRDWKG